MHDVFISYSHSDKQIANMVLGILEQNGVKCWIDYRDATVGINYAASIVHAIKGCKFFVLLLSEKSSNSPHVINEVNSAVTALKTILPFKIDESEISESIEYYVGKTHWLDAITPPMEAHIHELVATIRSYTSNNEQLNSAAPTSLQDNKPLNNGCRMMTLQELIAMGQTPSSIAIQLVENDYINCNGITDDNEGSAAQWEEFLQNDSDTFRYLVNSNGKIVGDWSIVALTEESFEQAIRGELLEKDLGVDNTEPLYFPGTYKLYILAMSLLPEYRTMQNHSKLVDSFLAQIEEYSNNDIYFDEICINVFAREVEAMIKKLGFKYVTDNKVFGKIYRLRFIPLPNIPMLKKHPRLIKNYESLK